MEQKHLNFSDTTNLGSFYTSEKLVNIAFDLISKNVNFFDRNWTILDTSCGYGNFLKNNNFNYKFKFIGGDIDQIAIEEAKKHNKNAIFFKENGLLNVSRGKYNIKSEEDLIIVGNPPYNDTTSLIKNQIKNSNVCNIDLDLKTRDLGISFLLSYNKLNPDYICVLHPLSYLIKEANFKLLKNFTKNYVLEDSIVVSSSEFCATSKSTSFPIIIAFYKKSKNGMNFDYIKNNKFKTLENKEFKLNDFDFINNYINKYPNKYILKDTKLYFWTMRDINALKRTKTWTENKTYNSIVVDSEKVAYYCYVDIFKNYIKNIPYYFGNCDVIIDNQEFKKIQNSFVSLSLRKNDFILKNLNHKINEDELKDNKIVKEYFIKLLGEHYV